LFRSKYVTDLLSGDQLGIEAPGGSTKRATGSPPDDGITTDLE
jgi:hypothetical protein